MKSVRAYLYIIDTDILREIFVHILLNLIFSHICIKRYIGSHCPCMNSCIRPARTYKVERSFGKIHHLIKNTLKLTLYRHVFAGLPLPSVKSGTVITNQELVISAHVIPRASCLFHKIPNFVRNSNFNVCGTSVLRRIILQSILPDKFFIRSAFMRFFILPVPPHDFSPLLAQHPRFDKASP